jgi:ATP synthase protein I
MGKKDDDKKNLAAYSTVGLMFPVSIAVGAGMGYWLDKWLNTAPYLLVIFTLYGVAAGFWNLYKVTKRMSDKNGKNH